jgi:hypothetical protein
VLFDFSSKVEAWHPMTEQDVFRARMLPLAPAPPANKGMQGTKAPRRTGVERASRSAVVKGRGRRSVTVVADQVLVNVEAGACDGLPLLTRQSYKDG